MVRREILDTLRTVRDGSVPVPARTLRDAATSALELGEPLIAEELCRQVQCAPDATPPLKRQAAHLQALALARSGASAAAHRQLNTVLEAAIDEGQGVDSETLGLLARTFKDLWGRACDPARKAELLRKALSHYEMAHHQSSRAWTGVNVATLRLASGKTAEAHRMAADVIALCQAGTGGEDATWTLLTQAECRLVMGDFTGAGKLYAEVRASGVPFGRISSARRNARIVLEAHLGRKPSLDEIFPGPSIVAFSGHRIDAPDRPTPRFPGANEDSVGRAIAGYLDEIGVEVGIASAADGSDILFHEALHARGAESHIVIPSPPETFVETSVNGEIRGDWRRRFHAVIDNAASVTVLTREARDPIDFLYANHVLSGLAQLKKEHYGGKLTGLAVWHPGEMGAPGGTTSAVRAWRGYGVPVTAIHPVTGRTDAVLLEASRESVVHEAGDQRIAALVFADAQGFSKLSNEHVTVFTRDILSPLAAKLDALGEAVLCRNTWGDAVYVAFSRPALAARFANDLVEACAPDRAKALGLPQDLRFRVSLHAGPVRMVYDPVAKCPNCIGSHVSWAARIEPITPAGSVYSSEAFAALCALDDADDIECAYVGHVPLAKGYGTMPTYCVSRAASF